MRLSKLLLGVLCSVLVVETAAAQELRPPELTSHLRRAETAWHSGASILEAKARVDRVLRQLPNDVQARKLRAQVLLALDRPEEALADARRAVELAPGDGEAYLILSETARVHGDTALAEQALEAAGERVLDDSSFHIRLSWNAAHLDQMDPAEAYARIAVALDQRNPLAYYQLARVFVMREQTDDAASVLVQGLEREVLDPTAIRSDTLLNRVADHKALEGFLRR